jgi:hypothetical protein
MNGAPGTLQAVAQAISDPTAIHGVHCVMSAQKLESQGAVPIKTPLEFANFVAETAPPEAQEHFQKQADGISKFSKGKMTYAEMRGMCG